MSGAAKLRDIAERMQIGRAITEDDIADLLRIADRLEALESAWKKEMTRQAVENSDD